RAARAARLQAPARPGSRGLVFRPVPVRCRREYAKRVGTRVGAAINNVRQAEPAAQQVAHGGGTARQAVGEAEIVEGAQLFRLQHDLQAFAAAQLVTLDGCFRHSRIPTYSFCSFAMTNQLAGGAVGSSTGSLTDDGQLTG